MFHLAFAVLTVEELFDTVTLSSQMLTLILWSPKARGETVTRFPRLDSLNLHVTAAEKALLWFYSVRTFRNNIR